MGLKDFFFKQDEELPVEAPKPQPAVTPVIVSPVQVNSNYVKMLEDLLDSRDLPGPDFLEFYKTLREYENQPVPEMNKYQMAFIALKTSGLTKDKIVSSSEEYVKALEKESENFTTELVVVKQRDVADKKLEAEKLTKESQELQQKIQDNTQRIASLNMEAMQAESNLTMKDQEFKNSVASAIAKIKDVASKTLNYIQ